MFFHLPRSLREDRNVMGISHAGHSQVLMIQHRPHAAVALTNIHSIGHATLPRDAFISSVPELVRAAGRSIDFPDGSVWYLFLSRRALLSVLKCWGHRGVSTRLFARLCRRGVLVKLVKWEGWSRDVTGWKLPRDGYLKSRSSENTWTAHNFSLVKIGLRSELKSFPSLLLVLDVLQSTFLAAHHGRLGPPSCPCHLKNGDYCYKEVT